MSEYSQKPNKSRCLACWFVDCRCKKGDKNGKIESNSSLYVKRVYEKPENESGTEEHQWSYKDSRKKR